ncbi:hypothetical protein GW17_00036352 [Ensete ventricosum]|nr:hypothetical protein GW17_00036352 [Ensete ventricosum]
MDSSGLSGELPANLSNLKNMRILRFQGNSFQGPIPASLSSLTKLTDLKTITASDNTKYEIDNANLTNGRTVAVKQLSTTSHQGKGQFLAEIATISAVQHRNLVKLHGCCVEEEKRILVYEYLENKSLDQAVFGKSDLHLDWPKRFDVLLGVARACCLCFFKTFMVELQIGTVDIRISNPLMSQAWTLHENRCDLEMVDRKLTSFDKGVVSRVIGIALLCTQASPVLRPPMSRVVAMLVGDTEVTDVTLRPSYLTEWQHKDVSSSYVTGYFDSSTQRSANAQVSFPSTDRTTVNMETTPLTTQPYMKKAIKEGR